jgi:acylglycerol lipase
MVKFQEGKRKNSRDQQLHTVQYLPDQGAPKAVLVWHHGYGEHLGRYKPVFDQLGDAGIAVYAQEAHGHGNSEPLDQPSRCLIWDWRHLVDDCIDFSKEVREQTGPSVPHFIGGQSMGGLVAALVALQNQSAWAGLILCSAAIDVEWTPMLRFQSKIGNLMAALIPRARIVPAVRLEDMSPDPAVVEDMRNDPFNFVGPVRARTGNELLKAFGEVARREAELTLPIYAHHGDTDRTTSLTAVKRLLQNCQSQDVTLNVVPGGYHELFMGPEKEQVTSALRDWMLSKQPKK